MSSPDALAFREAEPGDLPAIVGMLADDARGVAREDPSGSSRAAYEAAYDAIRADPNNQLLVATLGERIVGTLQLTFTPSLSYRGAWRATIESVRTEGALRGHGIGTALLRHAIERARQRGCAMVQLSTHGTRVDARRFYERLGFEPSHVGMKLHLR